MKNNIKNIIKSIFAILLSFAFIQGACAQDYKKQAKKKQDTAVEKSEAKSNKVLLKRIAESQTKGKKSLKKPTKMKKGQHSLTGLKEMKNGRPVIQFHRTGDPQKDKAAYIAAKKKWIAENPELYKKLISQKKQ